MISLSLEIWKRPENLCPTGLFWIQISPNARAPIWSIGSTIYKNDRACLGSLWQSCFRPILSLNCDILCHRADAEPIFSLYWNYPVPLGNPCWFQIQRNFELYYPATQMPECLARDTRIFFLFCCGLSRVLLNPFSVVPFLNNATCSQHTSNMDICVPVLTLHWPDLEVEKPVLGSCDANVVMLPQMLGVSWAVKTSPASKLQRS